MSDFRSMENVFQFVHILKRHIQEQIEQLDINIAPMHVRVLKIISKTPSCTAVHIANFLDRDKAQVTRMLNSLIEMQVIEKVPNPEDKRSQCLLVTQQGGEILKRIKGIDQRTVEKLQSGISEEELAEFNRITNKMISILGKN